MLSDDVTTIFDVAWWMMLFPGVFLLTTTLAFNLVGDGLRDALDPRGQEGSYAKKGRRDRRREAGTAKSMKQDSAEAALVEGSG